MIADCLHLYNANCCDIFNNVFAYTYVRMFILTLDIVCGGVGVGVGVGRLETRCFIRSAVGPRQRALSQFTILQFTHTLA